MSRAALAALPAALAGCFLWRTGDAERCPPDRTIVLGAQEDVTAFAGCKRASGLTIRTGATIDVGPLHDLEEVRGDVTVGPTVGIENLAFNGLVWVGGAIRVTDNGSLRGLYLPRLDHAGRLEVDGNFELTTIAIPSLVAVDGAVSITDNHDLEVVFAGALTTVGKELVVADVPKLYLIEAPKLVHVEALRVENAPKLPADAVDALRNKTP